MVVSSTTTLFQIRRQRNNTGTYYIKLLFITLLLGMLAYLASRNAVLCVLLNFTVPFALVFFQSDQFAPKGYFGYAMTFVFLELRPPTPEEFPVQMLCLLFCTLVLIGALLLYARLSAPSAPPEEEITRSLTRLAELLEELAGGGGADGARRELEGQRTPCLRGGCVSSTVAFSTACSCCWRRESPGPGGPGYPGGRYLPAAAGG